MKTCRNIKIILNIYMKTCRNVEIILKLYMKTCRIIENIENNFGILTDFFIYFNIILANYISSKWRN